MEMLVLANFPIATTNQVFLRLGSTNRRANLFEEMRRSNQVSSFEEQPRSELNSEAIDFRAASGFFKPTHSSLHSADECFLKEDKTIRLMRLRSTSCAQFRED
jgi:predicted HTH transcriptional regulator